MGHPYPPEPHAWPPSQPYAAPNPYAAPYAGPYGAGGPWSGPLAEPRSGGWIKWAYAGMLLVAVLLIVAGAAVMPEGSGHDLDYDQDMADLGIGMTVVGYLFFLLRMVLALVWVYQAWSAIPPRYRVTSTGKHVSPGAAVGKLFIPFFNLYWMFVVSVGLCDAMGSALASTGSYRTPAKGLAIASCVTQLVPYVNLFIAPFMWFFFMLSADGAKHEMLERLRSQQQGGGAPHPYAATAPGYPVNAFGGHAPYGGGPFGT